MSRRRGQGGGGGFGGPQAPVAEPGLYRVTLTVDGEEFSELVTVVEDGWMGRGRARPSYLVLAKTMRGLDVGRMGDCSG